MWLFQRPKNGDGSHSAWVEIGFFNPIGNWILIKQVRKEADAIYIVSYLNGGAGDYSIVENFFK